MHEGYPADWRHVTLHVSPDFKEVHADGDCRLGDHFRVLGSQLVQANEELDQYRDGSHPNLIMREEGITRQIQQQGIEFVEGDGTLRRLVWEDGDEPVGIASGWAADDDLWDPMKAVCEAAAELGELDAAAAENLALGPGHFNARTARELNERRCKVRALLDKAIKAWKEAVR